MPRLAPIETRTDTQLQQVVSMLDHQQLLSFAEVKRDQLTMALILGLRNPYATACARMLMSRCFAGGMHVSKGGTDVSEYFTKSALDYWTSLLQDVALHLFMFGFCVVRRDNPELGPAAIINPLDLRVQIRHIRGSTTYRVFDRLHSHVTSLAASTERPLDDIIVFDIHTPLSDGSLRSYFASMFETYAQLQLINESAVIAWRNGACPTVLTEEKFANQDQADIGRDISSAGDFSLGAIRQRRKVVDAADHIRAQQELQRATNRAPTQAMPTQAGDGTGGASMVSLPPGQTVSHVLPSAQPPDVQKFMDYVGEQVALIFGVPPMWKPLTRQASSNDTIDEQIHAAFESTTRLLKTVAEVLMADMNRVNGFMEVLHQAGDDPNQITDELISTQVYEVSFPGVVSMENIEKLRALGLLDHIKAREMVSDSLRISIDRLTSEAYDPQVDMPVSKRVKREDAAERAASNAKNSKGP